MKKQHNGERLGTIVESLSDITVVVLADFLRAGANGGGFPVTLALAELGVTVFPVGAVGEDEAGHEILHKLHEHRVSTSGISKLQKYATASESGTEQIHGEHPALLNLIEHARKFASAADAMYVCDHGIGAASPRVVNFIKSNRCLLEKTLSARSVSRLTDFEQLTTAIASEQEIGKAIGVEIDGDAQKLAVAGQGIVEELRLQSFLAVAGKHCFAFAGSKKPVAIDLSAAASAHDVDRLGAIFTAAVAADAEAADAAQVAVVANEFLQQRSGQRVRREELLKFVSAGSLAATR